MRLTDIFAPIPHIRRVLAVTPAIDDPATDFWIWLRSFQGIINRAGPHVYVIQGAESSKRHGVRPLCEDFWLDYYVKTFGIGVESASDIDDFIERYKHHVSGYVLYDTERTLQTQNLAITRAGLEHVLPIAPDQEAWMQRHSIRKVDDLRGRFKDDADAAEWAIDNLWPHCNKRMYGNFCVHRPYWSALAHTLEDYMVYHKGLVLDLPLSRQTRRTLRLYHRMLETAEAPGVQLNWHCIRDQEKEYVAEAAQHGFFTLCSVGTPNLTIHGGIGDRNAAYEQPMPARGMCRAENDKVYVCLYVSDGDATWAMNNLHSRNWLTEKRGQLKVGWGLLPLMTALMPGMLRYYHETRTPNDCFWGPSSGAAYTYTHLWPANLVEGYLKETRRLLDQTGQHGCNMVNWYLRDWWREVEDSRAVRREQDLLAPGPGLVCGLGGSPYAKSYLDGPIPKVHSVHIANVGQDNVGDIVRFAKECPTRPLFMFLFAQIAEGIWDQLGSERDAFAQHPEIVIQSMDEFFVTLQDAIRREIVGPELYEKTEAVAETWLRTPGRHRLPLCERLADELREIVDRDPVERRRLLTQPGWIELVSREIEHVAGDRDKFLNMFSAVPAATEDEEADTLLYVGFTLAFTLARAAIEAQGIYGNHRSQCLEDFRRTCEEFVDMRPFDLLFTAWDQYDNESPQLEKVVSTCRDLAPAASRLRERLGPAEDEVFTDWPPKTI